MKDQKAILLKCLKNDEPAFAIETMQAYYKIAQKNGAALDFLEDMQMVIDEMLLLTQ